MNYEQAMSVLEHDGFRWECLREYFPFGDIALREGDYQRLAKCALNKIQELNKKQLFLDLLDAQGCVFVEQVWVANELEEAAGRKAPFEIEAHFATAWLQINDNLRCEFGLASRGARSAMLALQPPETLVERIVAAVVHKTNA